MRLPEPHEHFFSFSFVAALSAVLVFGPYFGAQTPAGAGDNSVQELHSQGRQTTLCRNTPAGSHFTTKESLSRSLINKTGPQVSGVAVTFRLPESGAAGVFGDGNRIAVAYTDSNGQAAVRNIQWGNTAGTLLLRITATKGIVHAGILMEQKLGAPASRAQPLGGPGNTAGPGDGIGARSRRFPGCRTAGLYPACFHGNARPASTAVRTSSSTGESEPTG